MLITFPGEDYTPMALINPADDSGSTATVLASLSYLTDGAVRNVARITWPTGTQTTETSVAFQTNYPSITAPVRVAALVGTTFPVGTKVRLLNDDLFADPIKQLRMVPYPPDPTKTMVWFVLDATIVMSNPRIAVYNDVNGSHPFTAAQVFDVGEFFMDDALDVCVTDLSVQWVDPSVNNNTAGNSTKSFARFPYRQTTVTLGPRQFKAAYLAANTPSAPTINPATPRDIQTLLLTMQRARRMAIVPKFKQVHSTAVDDVLVQSQAQLVKLIGSQAIRTAVPNVNSGSSTQFTWKELL